MGRWRSNLLQIANVSLRNLTLQTSTDGPDGRDLKTFESLLDKWASLGFALSHRDLDTLEHPFLETIWNWCVDKTAPKILSRTGALGVQMSFAHREGQTLKTRVAALDVDLFRNKDKGIIDEEGRDAYLGRCADFHRRAGIPFFWSYSRSYGIHQWYFFREDQLVSSGHNLVSWIRNSLLSEGIFPEEVTKETIEGKIDLRPYIPNPTEISQTHRLSCPYSSFYPHSILFGNPDLPEDYEVPLIESEFLSRFTGPQKSTSSAGKKSESPRDEGQGGSRPSWDFAPTIYKPKVEWAKISREQDDENRRRISPFDSGLDTDNLPPCIVEMVRNRKGVPDGQWGNFSFLASQSITALNPDDKSAALDQVTDLLNTVAEIGGYPPASHQEYRPPLNSAYKEADKGFPLSCKKVDICRDNCCPTKCYSVRGGYVAAQTALAPASKPKIYKRRHTDPLADRHKKDKYISLCMLPYLKEEFKDMEINDPDTWDELFFQIETRTTSKYDNFVTSIRSPDVRNVDKYNMDEFLTSIPRKNFNEWFHQLAFSIAIPIDDPTPLYRGEFLNNMGRMISNEDPVALVHESDTDHPLRVWIDKDGVRRMGILENLMRSLAMSLIGRMGQIDVDEVLDHYTKQIFTGVVKMKISSNTYWVINFEEDISKITLRGGNLQTLERLYEDLAHKVGSVSLLNTFKKDRV